MNKYEMMLELNVILEMCKEEAFLDVSKDSILSLSPIDDIDLLNYKLDEVDEAYILLERMGKFPIHIKSDTNINFLLSKIHKNGVLEANELSEISNFLDTIRDINIYKTKLEDNKIDYQCLENKTKELEYFKDLNIKIRKIVTPYGEINDDASPLLRQIRKRIKDFEKNIQNKLMELLQKHSDKLTSPNVSIRNDHFVIPIKTDYKNHIKGIIHDQSSSGETTFIEPQVVLEMNNELNRTKEDEKKEIFNILRSISLEIDNYYDSLLYSNEIIIDLDIIFAKAKLAKTLNCSRPKINNHGVIDLIKCYHPLLNVSKIVSNNVSLGKTYKGIIITGPNTGGKTVLLKTVGLLSLMVKYGLLIPCDKNSEIAIFDNVFCDIGDEQSISQNLSTFSSHLKNVIDIMDNVTNNSLVLVDELGSGTDPVEGSSLAIAIINHLLSINCDIIATSHYSELKLFAYNNDKLINASVEFNVETLKPTYRLLIGVPGMSNALKIASTLGLNKEIINNANQYVSEKNDNLSVMLDKLVNQSTDLDNKLRIIEEEKIELSKLIQLQNLEIEKTRQERDKIIIKANLEKDQIIQKAKNELEDLVYEIGSLKNKNIKPHEISDLKHKIRTLGNEDLELSNDDKEFNIEIGMSVFVKGYNSYGTVIKELKNDKYEVQIGIASVKVNKEDLQKDNNPKINNNKKTITPNNNTVINIKKNVSSKLDLRGLRYEEAEDLIDKFLDDAIYANLKSVTIIHGFGTGTIRKLVHSKLDRNKFVDEYHYGGQGEGGQGATIVNFK